jgi:DNA-binding MarR family transcriptional regulator
MVSMGDTDAMADQPTVAEVHHAWVLVQQAAQMLQAAADARLRSQGLNLQCAAILNIVRTHGRQPMSVLARFLLLHTQTLTDVIDRLEHAGLVERTRHPTDRRKVQVALTVRGRREAEAAVDVLAVVAETAFQRLPDEEMVGIATVLAQVRTTAGTVAGIPIGHFAYATDTLALQGTPAA